ncbi:HDOD domain-containing protein [Cupriavidus consociatus]|uniref:HDOD domain-containing protein n=1 Tax=Cupriavidus consociatus TaxID=2821357 RepID=UPI001AE2B601|nr:MULTISPECIES: HDOD domain-containing protein [unclassified Cupriavidus]MBP0620698.1 HDOD domain-containing protein [Cupriavidus sp. LEh25]MDK2657358.1 HDOD domain-containing protein [Cupriavidus sp. LEh21]
MDMQAFLDQLWARLAEQGDFPTLQYCIDHVFSSLDAERNVGEMASSILSDFSLSQKIIRLSNSAMYRSFGGEVTTVSRAIMVLGVDTVIHLTLGVRVLDFFQTVPENRPRAAQALKQAMVAAEFTRTLAEARGIADGEEAVVCTLMHHVSRLLLILYVPEAWDRITAMCEAGEQIGEDEACREVLGVSLGEIARAAAIKWRLPPLIAGAMSAPPLPEGAMPETHADWLGAVARLSSQAAASILAGQDDPTADSQLLAEAQRVGLEPGHLGGALEQARVLTTSMAATDAASQAGGDPGEQGGKPADALARLQRVVAEVRQEGKAMSIAELAPFALESAMRALNFSRCFLMLLNPSARRFGARLAFGEGMRDKLDQLSFEEGFVPDVFHFATLADRPLLIEDSFDKEAAHRVPRWYRQAMPDARALLLIPVRVRNRCVALICGDWGEARFTGALTGEELEAIAQLAGEISAGFLRSAPAR